MAVDLEHSFHLPHRTRLVGLFAFQVAFTAKELDITTTQGPNGPDILFDAVSEFFVYLPLLPRRRSWTLHFRH